MSLRAENPNVTFLPTSYLALGARETASAAVVLAILLQANADPGHIANVPDWNQPVVTSTPPSPVGGVWSDWCVPTSVANIAGYYEDVHGVLGLGDGIPFPATTGPGAPPWQDNCAFTGPGVHVPQRRDIAWFMNTNGLSNGAGGCPGVCSPPFRGTHLSDIQFGATGIHGLVGPDGFFAFRGVPSVRVLNFGALALHPGVYAQFDNTGDPYPPVAHADVDAYALIQQEIDAERPLLAHFEYWKLDNQAMYGDIPGLSPDFFPGSDSILRAEWGPFTTVLPDPAPGGDGNIEQWDAGEGVGHTVTVVGYWNIDDPTNPFYTSANAIVLHDNTDGYDPLAPNAPLPVVVPWDGSPWMGLTLIRNLIETDGDVNGDGIVDVNDITYVIFRLGNTGIPGNVEGDADGNGIVDVNDISYVIFRL